MKNFLALLMVACCSSAATAQTNSPAPYCGGSIGAISTLQIDSVQLSRLGGAGFSPAMNNVSNYPAFGDRYTFFSNKVFRMPANVPHQLQLAFSGDTAHFLAIYIDWNGDGDFIDVDERVLHRTHSSGQPISKSISAIIPTPGWVMPDTTRMRVVLFEDDGYTYAAGNSAATPCTAFGTGVLNFGEVEDYTIVLAGTPMLTTLPATNIMHNSARLNGKIQRNGAQGVIYFFCSSAPGIHQSATYIPGTDSFYNDITNLQPGQTYTFQTYMNLEAQTPIWGTTLSFTTAPANIRDANGSEHSVFISLSRILRNELSRYKHPLAPHPRPPSFYMMLLEKSPASCYRALMVYLHSER